MISNQIPNSTFRPQKSTTKTNLKKKLFAFFGLVCYSFHSILILAFSINCCCLFVCFLFSNGHDDFVTATFANKTFSHGYLLPVTFNLYSSAISLEGAHENMVSIPIQSFLTNMTVSCVKVYIVRRMPLLTPPRKKERK